MYEKHFGPESQIELLFDDFTELSATEMEAQNLTRVTGIKKNFPTLNWNIKMNTLRVRVHKKPPSPPPPLPRNGPDYK